MRDHLMFSVAPHRDCELASHVQYYDEPEPTPDADQDDSFLSSSMAKAWVALYGSR